MSRCGLWLENETTVLVSIGQERAHDLAGDDERTRASKVTRRRELAESLDELGRRNVIRVRAGDHVPTRGRVIFEHRILRVEPLDHRLLERVRNRFRLLAEDDVLDVVQ